MMVKEKEFYRTLLAVAIPAAFQAFISLSVNMLDNIMVGSLGDVSLASVSLANQVGVFITFFIKGIGGGSSVLISQYAGKKDMQSIKAIFSTVFQFAALSLFLISSLLFLFPAQTLGIFTNDQTLISTGFTYIKIVAYSYFLFAMTDSLVSMMRTAEVVRLGIIVSFITLFSNLTLNYVLIFGKLGLPALGVNGAALATLLSRMIELLIVFIYVFKLDKKINLKVKELLRLNRDMIKDFATYGLPIVFGDSQWGFVGFIKGMMIGRLGVLMIAANSVADTVLSLAMIFTSGLSNGAVVTVGKAVGSGDFKKARAYSNTIQILFALVGLCVASLVFFSRGLPPLLYNISQEARQMASIFLGIGALTHIGTCYHAACFVGINRGAGDGKFVMKVDLICGWLVVLPLTFLAAFVLKLPLPAIYLFTRIDQCFKWIIAFLRLQGDRWMKNVTR